MLSGKRRKLKMSFKEKYKEAEEKLNGANEVKAQNPKPDVYQTLKKMGVDTLGFNGVEAQVYLLGCILKMLEANHAQPGA